MKHQLSVLVHTPAHSQVAKPLSYGREQSLAPGTLVRVPLGKRELLGLVWDTPHPAEALDAPEADASVTTQPGVVCAILSADCMPVLLCDSRGQVVGAAHAGWRGLAAGVVENTVRAMQEAGADRLLAWLGPAIGPQQFEVGEDVRAAFAHLGRDAEHAFVAIQGQSGKYWANLPQLARLALARVGVTQVAGGADCTVSDTQQFYSFRRDRITGRMASLIWIR